MVPFCRTISEAKKVITELKLNGLSRQDSDLELYMMCEIPSNALLAEDFAQLFDGFSIGSNDLTQLTLGVDRNNEKLADLFSENDPAVLALIEMAITGAHKKGKKIGLCGQSPSDDASFAKFLVEHKIDSLSVNPDAVIQVTESVMEFEQEENLMDKVRDIMSKSPVYCLADANLEFAAKLMLEHDCGEIPIVDNERDLNPIGVITDRDICCRTVALGKNPLQLKVRDFMTSPAKFITVDTTVKR
jgi:phosphoenolpyruvate-protein kinase (PTS system EI component)